MPEYTDRQVDILLNSYLRNSPRHMPFPAVVEALGLEDAPVPDLGWDRALLRVLWGLWTGYGSPVDPDVPTGPRKRLLYHPTGWRTARNGQPWRDREDRLLRLGMAGEGKTRHPPVTCAYLAPILQRGIKEVAAHWEALKPPDFGLVQ